MEKTQEFVWRHIGPRPNDINKMLAVLGYKSLDDLIDSCLPSVIRTKENMAVGDGCTENELLLNAKELAKKNKVFKSYIGLGYHPTIIPGVIQRNILENPGWYTAYTPYQAEISQGRMEALLNFQTMLMELTGFDVANASLLDEGTAAAEAMALAFNLQGAKISSRKIFVDKNCFPQTIDVLKTRAKPLGLELIIDDANTYAFNENIFAGVLQYPDVNGEIKNPRAIIEKIHNKGGLAIMACDVLALALLQSPKALGADIAIGSTQRFGVPMGYGGPHAAYIATKDEYKRLIPGRFIGVSRDMHGRRALRLALQTREQHIRREKATSNICTAQVLLAVMASMYVVYHGREGLQKIANRVAQLTQLLKDEVSKLGYKVVNSHAFDTLTIETDKTSLILQEATKKQINFWPISNNSFSIAINETTSLEDVSELVAVLSLGKTHFSGKITGKTSLPNDLLRSDAFLAQPVFNKYHSETEMLRYIRKLESKDLSLTTSMIALGSCTMKLNASAEMYPISLPEFSSIHPFAPMNQTVGYQEMFSELEKYLATITGFAGVSLQPNAGSQGEYAGLLVIKAFHEANKDFHRNICLIPSSAHGTNPASAVMAGMKVVVVNCDSNGNVDLADLKKKAQEHSKNLAALMVTYPSTHGVFEESIVEVCKTIHAHGGQVYMDGANMNALVGLARPCEIGADVVHINLHKTFCIPHGGGGPGMGPIGVAKHLVEFLPGHAVVKSINKNKSISAVSAAPWGSASILPISWAYIKMMGNDGLTLATKVSILNANYIAKRLDPHFPVLYKGKNNLVAHECIVDLRPIKADTGITVDDVAKRLIDYGFHAPTMSFPVAGTLMIEPTESESKEEIDRFCEALISIHQEIKAVADGSVDKLNNALVNAPHSADLLCTDKWNRPYSREQAAYPKSWLKEHKYWPPVSRVDNVYGDKNFICSCPSIEEYSQ